jgi:ATP-binding cassette, subfamily F, member 3
MSLARINNVTVRFEERLILREIYFKLARGERVGLIGANGSGKTTLLRLLLTAAQQTAHIEPLTPSNAEGRVELERGLRIGYFSQFSTLDGARSIESTLEDVFSEVRAIEAELERISLQFEREDADLDQLLARQSELLELMEQKDGWNWQIHIETALGKLGFDATRRALPIERLSGGWRNRAALAQILLTAPDILLLDEPTNYLDLEGVAWLEDWLKNFRGAILVVSHDRTFLDAIVTRLVEVENYKLNEFLGGYSEYAREKPFRLKTAEKRFLHEEELLILEAEAIEARRDRKLADLKKRTIPRAPQMIVTEMYSGLRARENLLRTENLTKGYGNATLFSELTIELHAGERLAILGRNGCGKSTLLKILLGEETPDSGRVLWEGGSSAAHFNGLLAALPAKDTLSHAINTFGVAFHAPRKQVHRFLELLRFSEADLQQRLGQLSGGQRARVALAQCLLSGAPVVILDEPTNHLDVPSIQVMEQAILHFPGAVILASHDRFFIERVATRELNLGNANDRD